MSTLYSIGLMNQLGDALEKAGFTNGEVVKLKQFKNLEQIKDVLSGCAKIKHFIDCDSDPFSYEGLEVMQHKRGGQLTWDPTKILLYVSQAQQGKGIDGYKLREELENKPVLNANVLDYLLAKPYLIPEVWIGDAIFFWGTIYCSSSGDPSVRCLYWDSDLEKWNDQLDWFRDDNWQSGSSAALLME